jgi:hypothetical protein
MYRTIYNYLLSVPIGSHIHFCVVLRGPSRLVVLVVSRFFSKSPKMVAVFSSPEVAVSDFPSTLGDLGEVWAPP